MKRRITHGCEAPIEKGVQTFAHPSKNVQVQGRPSICNHRLKCILKIIIIRSFELPDVQIKLADVESTRGVV